MVLEKKARRNDRIDIIKGIGIILMVFYHASTPGRDFVYLFHMALFFISSGYCYSHNSEKKPIYYIKKKIVSLYIPCAISGIVIACLQNVFLDIHIYSYDVYSKLDFIEWLKQILKCLAFAGGHQMIGANWFFRTLFFASILYMFIQLMIGRLSINQNTAALIRFIICVVLTTIGGIIGYSFSFGKYFNFFTVVALLDTGFDLKEYQIFEQITKGYMKVAALLFSILILIALSCFGTISINNNQIISTPFFLTCSIAGFVFVYYSADVINSTYFRRIFTYIGKNSIWIMFFHYVGFKIITLAEILVLGEPIVNLSAYPTHHTEYGLWAVYGIVGVAFPLLLVKAWDYAGKLISNRSKIEDEDQKEEK